MILLITSFLAGVAVTLSPCILPILPIMLSGAVGGRNRPYGIIAGFILSFSVFTLFLTSIISSLGISVDTLRGVGAAVLIILGLFLLIPKLNQFFKNLIPAFASKQDPSKTGFWSGFFTGVPLGLIWTPCAGPILAAVITLTVTSSVGFFSFLMILAFSLGTSLVMLLITLGSRRLLEKIRTLNQYTETIQKVFGILIILTGLAIASGVDRSIQTFILDNTPDKWNEFLQKFENNEVIKKELEKIKPKPMPKKPENTEPTISDQELPPRTFPRIDTDTSKSLIDLNQILSGGPGKDGIPAINNPALISIEETDIEDETLGILVQINSEKRFYPYNILVWHEIVNDSIGDTQFSVTFCPLCGTAIVYDRQVMTEDKTEILTFGVSGFLHESNLLMYDKSTESFWAQATGQAVVGEYTGTKLTRFPIQRITFAELKKNHSDAQVMSDKTGYFRDYSRYPYGDYDESEAIYFPTSTENTTFHPKEIMYVINLDDTFYALPLESIPQDTTTLSNPPLTITKKGSEITITQNDEVIPGFFEMWFSWATQHEKDGILLNEF